MFQPAASIRTQVQNESVVVIGNLPEHRNFGFHNLLYFAAQTDRVVVAFAIDHDAVRHPAHLEVELLEVANFNWRVVKNVKAFGAKTIFLSNNGWQSSCDFPTRRRHYP